MRIVSPRHRVSVSPRLFIIQALRDTPQSFAADK
jgi:hypothetical protein